MSSTLGLAVATTIVYGLLGVAVLVKIRFTDIETVRRWREPRAVAQTRGVIAIVSGALITWVSFTTLARDLPERSLLAWVLFVGCPVVLVILVWVATAAWGRRHLGQAWPRFVTEGVGALSDVPARKRRTFMGAAVLGTIAAILVGRSVADALAGI